MATIPPDANPASTPVLPYSTSLTSSSLTTHRQTRSLAAASSAGEPAVFAAVSAYGSRLAGLRAHNVVS
jgi:hypothetical protein